MEDVAKERILIAGGTGLIGRSLIDMIDLRRYDIILLSRVKRKSKNDSISYVVWQPDKLKIGEINIPDHIINLAGAGIGDFRWSENRKKELIQSRVDSAKTLENYLKNLNVKPKTYISASAVGYYGNRGNEILNEYSKKGYGFLSECCVNWEDAAFSAGSYCERIVIHRIGIVISSLGGAFPKMLITKKFGLLNFFGNGQQYYPWIHIEDLSRLLYDSIGITTFTGVYNAIASQQITNKAMMRDIKFALKIKGLILSVPAFILRIVLGEMANIVLNSARVTSERIFETGFRFRFDKIGEAVKDVFQRKI